VTDVTIVVCTWNRVRLLEQTLKQFDRLRVPGDVRWDVLVVDNNSTDDTARFLPAFQPSYAFRSVHERQPGQSSALNRALSETTSDLNLLTDDDVLVHENWLAEFWEGARRHPEAAVFGGPIEPWFVEPPDADLVEVFPMLKRGFAGIDYGSNERALPAGSHVVGANMAVRRSRLQGLSFRSDLGPTGRSTVNGAEVEFQNAIRGTGGTVIWLPRMRLQHYVDPARMNARYLLGMHEDFGRMFIRRNGVPPGPRFAGVPRWMFRQVLEHQVRAWWQSLRRRRRQALEHWRQHREALGMIRECRNPHVGPTL
jgi:glycosyltransferase involved in cell wall biosynthesis